MKVGHDLIASVNMVKIGQEQVTASCDQGKKESRRALLESDEPMT